MVDRSSFGLAIFVDLFFVISGYVIAHVYAERVATLGDFGQFMKRRFGRLVPLHWLTFVLSIAVWIAILMAGARAEHTPSLSPLCLSETTLLVQAAYPCGGIIFNGVSWSISAEMGMYVAFPLICFLARRSRYLPLLLAASFLGVISVSTDFSRGPSSVWAWTEIHPYLRAAPSFLFGVGLWYCRSFVQRLPAPQVVLVLALTALVCVMLELPSATVTLALVAVVAVAAIAADLQKKAGPIVKLFAPLGQLTYSIYMWHWLFILIIMNIVGDKLLNGQGLVMAALAIATYLSVLAWSYISFQWIETPARRYIDRRPIFSKPKLG